MYVLDGSLQAGYYKALPLFVLTLQNSKTPTLRIYMRMSQVLRPWKRKCKAWWRLDEASLICPSCNVVEDPTFTSCRSVLPGGSESKWSWPWFLPLLQHWFLWPRATQLQKLEVHDRRTCMTEPIQMFLYSCISSGFSPVAARQDPFAISGGGMHHRNVHNFRDWNACSGRWSLLFRAFVHWLAPLAVIVKLQDDMISLRQLVCSKYISIWNI